MFIYHHLLSLVFYFHFVFISSWSVLWLNSWKYCVQFIMLQFNSSAPERCGSILKKHNLRTNGMSFSGEIALRSLLRNAFDDKSALVLANDIFIFMYENYYILVRISLVFWFTIAQSTKNAIIGSDNGPDNKVHGANMGPTWVLSAPDGPHAGPMNLAVRELGTEWVTSHYLNQCQPRLHRWTLLSSAVLYMKHQLYIILSQYHK